MFKKNLFSFLLLLFGFVAFHVEAQTRKAVDSDYLDIVINNHNQIFELSCIPSAIEIILKYHKAVNFDFYNLQETWQNKIDGSFRDFHNRELYGIRFSQEFVLARDESFPIDSLFQTIDAELKSDKKVVISLPSETGWHMFVIYKKTSDGEFVSYSKLGSHTLIVRNTKEIVRKSKGTEIMTYRLPTDL